MLFNKMGAQKEKDTENNEFHFWQAVFDLS